MKRLILIIVMGVVVTGLTGVRAEETQDAWPQKDQAKFLSHLERRSRHRLHFVSWELKLTPEQKTTIEAILKDKDEKTFALEKEFREKKATLRAETKEKVLAVLNPEQKDFYENGRGQKGGSQLHDQMPGRYKGGGLHED